MQDWTTSTTQHIEAADLPAPVYRTARRLLDLAAATGQHAIKLDHNGALGFCGTDSPGTMRRHLGTLAKHGIIHYSVNGAVHVSFCAAPVLTECAPTRAECAPILTQRAQTPPPVITERASTRTERAQPATILTQRAPVITECAPTRAECASSSSSLSLSLTQKEKTETKTKTETTRRASDPAYAAICRKWEQEGFGLITPMVEKQLGDALAAYPDDWIAKAMDRAVARGKRHWSYTQGILRNWQREGFNGDADHQPAQAAPAAARTPSPVVPPDDYEPEIPMNMEWIHDPVAIAAIDW